MPIFLLKTIIYLMNINYIILKYAFQEIKIYIRYLYVIYIKFNIRYNNQTQQIFKIITSTAV